jgi:hypothetical protein
MRVSPSMVASSYAPDARRRRMRREGDGLVMSGCPMSVGIYITANIPTCNKVLRVYAV